MVMPVQAFLNSAWFSVRIQQSKTLPHFLDQYHILVKKLHTHEFPDALRYGNRHHMISFSLLNAI